ncbi:MAG: M48 family metalloprotease [Candidatus Omnitrophica bacterium]|nr:M48 family metalloprotease [Candidatus Omnitrophota bacterium]
MRLRFLISLAGLVYLSFFASGCASVHSPRTLGPRITESQNEWRYSGGIFYGDKPIQYPDTPDKRIQNILNRLTYVSPLRGHEIKALYIKDSSLNARTDGHKIYLNLGLVKALWHDDSMLAAILAHELGHMIAKHEPPGNGKYIFLQVMSPMLGLVPFGGAAGTAVKESVRMNDRAYERFQEREADAIAVVLLHSAGYDPHALSRFFGMASSSHKLNLQNVSVPTQYSNPVALAESALLFVLRSSPLYKTHPPSKKRQETVELMTLTVQGALTPEQLKRESRWLDYVYTTIEQRLPRND